MVSLDSNHLEERTSLIDLLKEYKDVFAWSYDDMPGLRTDIVQHKIPLYPDAKPVKQKLRRMRPEWTLKIKEEVEKQLKLIFLLRLPCTVERLLQL